MFVTVVLFLLQRLNVVSLEMFSLKDGPNLVSLTRNNLKLPSTHLGDDHNYVEPQVVGEGALRQRGRILQAVLALAESPRAPLHGRSGVELVPRLYVFLPHLDDVLAATLAQVDVHLQLVEVIRQHRGPVLELFEDAPGSCHGYGENDEGVLECLFAQGELEEVVVARIAVQDPHAQAGLI
jgi:hypothetical protein